MSRSDHHLLYRTFGKRTLDLTLVLLSLPISLIIIAALTVLVRLIHGSPALFRQLRPGLRERAFVLYKFRTMTDARDQSGALLPDRERLTAFGRWLRATSLDELPELWNVLRGDMSLVGPRPLLMEYLPRYTPAQSRRHDVKPGLTGWAQVRGRNALRWEEKFALDIEYTEQMSLLLDLRILLATVLRVVNRQGVNAAGEATMPLFMGSTTESPVSPKHVSAT
jgi:lipopolysaccharide/colanic/teichoic acid biosynthesis glycosyltransferase